MFSLTTPKFVFLPTKFLGEAGLVSPHPPLVLPICLYHGKAPVLVSGRKRDMVLKNGHVGKPIIKGWLQKARSQKSVPNLPSID